MALVAGYSLRMPKPDDFEQVVTVFVDDELDYAGESTLGAHFVMHLFGPITGPHMRLVLLEQAHELVDGGSHVVVGRIDGGHSVLQVP